MEIPYTVQNRPDTGIYNAKVGIWLFLASEVMLFGGLFSAYVLLRAGAEPGMWPHRMPLLPAPGRLRRHSSCREQAVRSIAEIRADFSPWQASLSATVAIGSVLKIAQF